MVLYACRTHAAVLVVAAACFVGWIRPAVAAPPLSLQEQIKFFERRVAARASDYSSRAILGRLYLKAAKETGDGERYDEAEDTFRAALKINPRDPASQLGLASALMAQHQFADALALAKSVWESDQHNFEALAAIGDAQVELGQYDEADVSFQKLHESFQTAPVLARLARMAELRGQQQQAIDLLAQALHLAKSAGADKAEQSWYLQQIGDLEMQRGKLDQAAERFEAVLNANPLHPTALPALALVRTAQNDYEESEKLYDRALKHRPTEALVIAFGEVHEAQGEIAEAKHFYALAQSHLEHAADVEEEAKPAPEKQKPAAPAPDAKDKHDHFHGDFSHSHSHRYPEAHQRQLSLFYSEHNLRPELALELAQRELQVRKDIYTYDALAWALYRNGKFEEASRASDEALKLGTRDARLWFHAGMIEHKLGRRERALERLLAVAEINPNFSLIDRNLAKTTLEELQRLR